MGKIKRLFCGRVGRVQWILGVLAVSLPPSIFLATIAQLDNPTIDAVFPLIAALLLVPAFVLSISLHVRRMHDTNRSGLYFFLSFVPLANLYYLYLLLRKGDVDANSYGEPTTQRGIYSMILNTETNV